MEAQLRLQVRLPTAIGPLVRLSPIGEAALRAWETEWVRRSGRPRGWNWREQQRRLAVHHQPIRRRNLERISSVRIGNRQAIEGAEPSRHATP